MLGQYSEAEAGTVACMPYHLEASVGLLLQAPGPGGRSGSSVSCPTRRELARSVAGMPGQARRQSAACP